jgi:hypothetical protein
MCYIKKGNRRKRWGLINTFISMPAKKSAQGRKPAASASKKRSGPTTKASKTLAKSPSAKKKVKKVMHEYKEGELHSGSKKGPKVTSRKQAIAIALSEAGASNKQQSKKKASTKRSSKKKSS